MRKALTALLAIVVLAAAAVGGHRAVNLLVNSIYTYHSPLIGSPALTQASTRPLTQQVILVTIDGLRYDTSFQMPYLNQLRIRGAQARLINSPTSSTQAAWTTLLTGAAPDINEAPLFDRPYEWMPPIAVDHLVAAANRAGLKVAVAGFHWWERLLAPHAVYARYFVNGEDASADLSVTERAVTFLTEFRPHLLLVTLRQVEDAGQRYGALSPEYRQAALACDENLRILASHVDLEHGVLIVTSGHGHLDWGGHGGDEPIVLHTPFVMVGQSVAKDDYGTAKATDITPTIAALLGAPVPSLAQGDMRLDMFETEHVDEAEKYVALANQRLRLGSIYVYSLSKGTLSETAQGDALVAASSLQVKNYASAAELGHLSVEQTNREMEQSSRLRLRNERRQRAPWLALTLVLPLLFIWRARSSRVVWSLIAAVLGAGLYHVMFLRGGHVYSFSAIAPAHLAETLQPGIRYAGLALAAGGLIIVWRTWRERQRSALEVALQTYAFALLQLFVIGVGTAACIWWNGPSFSWRVPDLRVAYLQSALLTQAMLVAGLAIPLPLGVIVLQRVLLALEDLARRHTAGRPSRPRSASTPGWTDTR